MTLISSLKAPHRPSSQATPLCPIKSEEGLGRPIQEWRADLNIEPAREGLWSWYSRPNLAAAIAEQQQVRTSTSQLLGQLDAVLGVVARRAGELAVGLTTKAGLQGSYA